MKKNKDLLSPEKVMPLLAKADDKSKYNSKNVSRFIKSRKEVNSVPYSPIFMEAASEAGVANFYLQCRLSAVCISFDIYAFIFPSAQSASERATFSTS